MRKIIILCLMLVLAVALTACSSSPWSAREQLTSKGDKIITVGSSNFTEVYILGNIYKELIEANTDIKVKTSFGLNSAVFCFAALERGDIDMVVEYSGTVLANIIKQPMDNDPDSVYKTVSTLMRQEHGVHTSAPLGFNNTYVMSVKPETAQRYNLKTLTDLMKVAPELRLGCTMEFVQREDCLPLLESIFSTTFKDVSGLDASVRYVAINSGQVEVIDAFSTDALLAKMGLTRLEDDVKFFPPYYACNFIRLDTLDKYSEIVPILAGLDGLIDEQCMAHMNAQVDVEGKDATEVAHQFLLEAGLIPQ